MKLFINGTEPSYEKAKQIEGIEFYNVHDSTMNKYHFLLGSAIVYHNGILRCSFCNSLETENDSHSVYTEKCSYDSGKTWVQADVIGKSEERVSRSHGAYFQLGKELYTFCARAEFGYGDGYPNLVMESYILENDKFVKCDDVCSNFWPLNPPLALDNNRYIMGGLECKTFQAAVALCDGTHPTKWEMKTIPNCRKTPIWGETTVLKQSDSLSAIIRGEAEKAYISKSFDNGETWSEIEQTDLICANSKLYAGTLSDGRSYVIFNMANRPARKTMAIAVSSANSDMFENVYIIKDGFEKKPLYFWNEWSYPYAIEHENKLYVVYSENKEDCELAVFPLQSLN